MYRTTLWNTLQVGQTQNFMLSFDTRHVHQHVPFRSISHSTMLTNVTISGVNGCTIAADLSNSLIRAKKDKLRVI